MATVDDVEQVLERSKELGFLGPGPVADHIRNARAFGAAIEDLAPGSTVLDLGAGGGVPGLVLAVDRPDLHHLFLDASTRRTEFLAEAVEELGRQDAVEVVHGRAEELARRPDLRAVADVVVARSFGAPAVTAECAAGFLRGPGCRLVVSEPPEGSSPRWPTEGLAELGLAPGDRVTGEGVTIQTIHMVASCPDRFPRRVGVPAKRPLF